MLIWRGVYLGTEAGLDTVEGPVFAPRAVENEPRCVGADAGSGDADSACFLTRVAGVAAGAVIYLNIDDGCSADYFVAWVEGVKARGFTPGVTGSPAAVVLLGERGIDLALWVFRAVASEGKGAEHEGAEQWVH